MVHTFAISILFDRYIIGFVFLSKFYLSITIYKTIPLSAIADISLYTRETGEYVQIQGNYIGQNHNKFLAHSRRGEQCVKSNMVYRSARTWYTIRIY